MEAMKEYVEQQLRPRRLRLDCLDDPHNDIYTTPQEILNVDQRRYCCKGAVAGEEAAAERVTVPSESYSSIKFCIHVAVLKGMNDHQEENV